MLPVVVAIVLGIVLLIIYALLTGKLPALYKLVTEPGKDFQKNLDILTGQKEAKLKSQEDARFVKFFRDFLTMYQACSKSASSECLCKLPSTAWFPERYFIHLGSSGSAYYARPGYIKDDKEYPLPDVVSLKFFPPEALRFGAHFGVYCYIDNIAGSYTFSKTNSLLLKSDGTSFILEPVDKKYWNYNNDIAYPLASDIYFFKTKDKEVCFLSKRTYDTGLYYPKLPACS